MILGSASLASATDTLLYQVPADRRAVLTVSLCNRATAPVTVRVAVTGGAVPAAADWIEFDTPLPAAGNMGGSAMERTGVALGAGQRLYVRASAADVSAVAYGVEEDVV